MRRAYEERMWPMPCKALLVFPCSACPADEDKIRLLDRIVADAESNMAAVRYATIYKSSRISQKVLVQTIHDEYDPL